MMSSEFGLSSGKSMFKILIAGYAGGQHLRGWNSLKWLAFPKFQIIEGVVVIVVGKAKNLRSGI